MHSKLATDLSAKQTSQGTSEVSSDSPELKAIWLKISESLARLVGADAYERWFKTASLVRYNETSAVVEATSDIHQVWIETNYLPELQSAVSEVLDASVVKVTVPGENQDLLAQPRQQGQRLKKSSATGNDESLQKKLKHVGLNPQFNFSRFVVGQNNEFAHAACSAVATQKGITYNPLFIHGGPGLGKTHLMQSIGYSVLRTNPGAKVVYLTCEKFTNEYIDALRKGDIEKFRNKYRKVDILLIDDIQFLAAKDKSQEEFFHTFNTLLDMQSQVVLTSDRPACEIKKLEARLVSRFECGLTVELEAPRLETRVAILNRKMEDWDVKLSEDVVYFLAERIRSNVRRLEGGLVRLATFASLGGGGVNIERAESLLKDILREEGSRQITIDSIQKQVSEHYDVRLADMSSRRRPANIAHARQVAMFLSRRLTNSSLIEIGDAFGGRDHGTVIHAVKKVEQKMGQDNGLKDTVDLLDAMLQRR